MSIQPVPDWVERNTAPPASAKNGEDRILALRDFQSRHDATTDRYYTHSVTDLLSPKSIGDLGTLSLDFDPSYQTLALHHVRIVRDGETLDAADFSEAMVFRTETDRSQMIFNGTLTFSMPILDLRVGDRLDVAFSTTGRNPAIGAHFGTRQVFASASDIRRLFRRVSVHEDLEVHTKAHNGAPEPERFTQGPWQVFRWDAADPAVTDYDSDLPPWVFSRKTYEMTSLGSWGAVGGIFAGNYAVTPEDQAAVAPIVAELVREHASPDARARAALDWVQRNIRYVGLELGEGGFVPRPVTRVLRRRFGDCKDVTRLLLAILEGMEIEADAMLVHTEERGREFDGLPFPYAFDHVIVLAEVDGELFALDATGSPQMGTLRTADFGSYRKGLRLVDGRSRVVNLPQRLVGPREHFEETFDLVSEDDAVLYTFKVTERGAEADYTRQWLARDGRDGVQQSYFDYLRDIHPTLEITKPVTVSFDESEAMAVTSMEFRIPRDADGEDFSTRAYQMLAVMPEFDGSDRRSPLSISHPEHIRHDRIYLVDDRYNFDDASRTIKTPAFVFRAFDTLKDERFVESYEWQTLEDHIAVDGYADTMASVSDARNLSFTTIDYPDEVDAFAGEDMSAWMRVLLGLLSLGALIWMGVAGVRGARRAA